eukprot:CAMPEP_0167758218 /NCGR_PEP_ID=MMETSP0110_2-20121227/10349_1 /TAXON_ID=629695 /ORGANISM="Gymnochlora sp., Strain CCMP2014" /LENGTH=99 /DNA_ID=CAMNT_0007644475 /DNA_START=274 /DNA_END=573 /DNA_ORIENTATION=-
MNNVIPIYGRGASQEDPRKDKVVPDRPRAHRPSASQLGIHRMSVGVGSMGFIWESNSPPNNAVQGQDQSQEHGGEEHQEQLSRMLLFLGSLVILCLLTF